MAYQDLIFGIAAVLCAGLFSFTLTPLVRVFAYKIGAIDIPKDNRRMHKKPTPRIGGLAIFIAFLIATFVFCRVNPTMVAIWTGGALLVFIGVLDDCFGLNAWLKLLVQITAAVIAISQGVVIEHINFFGRHIGFGYLSIPITMIWIVGLTNAINLIDGLDGLACGISAICSVSLFAVTLLFAEPEFALITAIIAGCCIGFLPFNANPAKIFMGDAGALFLGYAFAILSISGIFKLHAIISFVIPLSIFGLPLFDTTLAFTRRILKGKSPFSADRGHLHHKLVDMGFGHKQTVRILYAVCGILGISAILFTDRNLYKAGFVVIAALIVFIIVYALLKNPATRVLTGLENKDLPQPLIPEEEVAAVNAFIKSEKNKED